MSDQRTRRIELRGSRTKPFRRRHRALLVVVAGGAEGSEFALDSDVVHVGRGPGVELAFPDPAMSRRHAAFELVEEGFRVRDLGSTNGVVVNGGAAQTAALKHGDRVQLGGTVFQYVVEKLEDPARTYTIPES